MHHLLFTQVGVLQQISRLVLSWSHPMTIGHNRLYCISDRAVSGHILGDNPVFYIRYVTDWMPTPHYIIIDITPPTRVGGPIMSHVNFKSFHSAMVVLLNFYILQG